MIRLIGGCENLNDAQTLRHAPVHQIASDSASELASAPTLCRFENQQARAAAWAVNAELVEQFITSHRQAPAVLILDFDGLASEKWTLFWAGLMSFLSYGFRRPQVNSNRASCGVSSDY